MPWQLPRRLRSTLTMTSLMQAKAWGAAAMRRGHAWALEQRAHPVPALIAVAWFTLTFAATVWVWGLNPQELASPDEALNRLAAAVLAEQGHPFLSLPFPDPENLAHPRHWVTVGAHALPSYAP